jgi:hypothetical protein
MTVSTRETEGWHGYSNDSVFWCIAEMGANASQPNLGTPPKVEPIGEWHLGQDGVPVMGPPPNPETPAKPATAETDGRSRTDGDSTPGKR